MCWALIIAGYVHSNLTEQQGKNPKEILGETKTFRAATVSYACEASFTKEDR
ncbi:hypothetical protein AAZX31_13G265900 [Glycine max]